MDEHKKRVMLALLGVGVCIVGLALAYCIGHYNSGSGDTITEEGRNVTRTIQQLETDEQGTERAVNTATERVEDAQDTTERLSESVDRSASVLDRLQAELDRIAEANGLTE